MSDEVKIRPNLWDVIDDLTKQLATAMKDNAMLRSHIVQEEKAKKSEPIDGSSKSAIQFRDSPDLVNNKSA